MERIVLKHLSGSKANQVEEFPLAHVKELVLGRDPSSTVKYDPDRDDLVGRQHARIAPDPVDPSQFVITDLNSRNGTFVNRQRITGTTRLNFGDVVQLGPGGPELIFEYEPRPHTSAKATRVVPTSPMAPTVSGAPATRVPDTGAGQQPFAPPTAPQPSGGVGKATVERIVAQNVAEAKRSQGRSYLLIGGAAVVAVLVLFAAVGGFLWWRMRNAERTAEQAQQSAAGEVSGLKQSLDAEKAAAPMKANDVVKNYGGAVVKIDVVWKLVSQQGNGLVYHQYMNFQGQPRAVYVRLNDGRIEPYLTYNSNPLNVAIGGAHSGSGFAVSSDGFILTNRHVAAAWETAYEFPQSANMGILLGPDGKPAAIVEQAPRDWVPARSKQDGIAYDGRNDRLDVSFPKSDRRLTAKLSAFSPRHDVAMIKVDSPGTLPKVELNDNYDTIQAGDTSVVLGYPAVSPPVLGIVKSQDVFNRETDVREIPDPTVTVGNVGRVLRGTDAAGQDKQLISVFGDAYQLQINTTGAGNSGGPVFDERGQVIGIFYAGRSAGTTSVTFAVPIRYGRELMGVK
ncbi:MAG TPA: trypsin-like peptidase domain-containing protein [Pyrinomonadaceae bacterium]|nr:trypsin-like peptidase domain-containing protein [Pyrinomonadaceae bacterium]